MKRYVFALLVFSLLAACNSDKKNQEFTISGTVEGIADQKITLQLVRSRAMETVKEFTPVQIVNGKFEIKGRLEKAPALVTFSLEDTKITLYKRFVIDNSDMTVSINRKKEEDGFVIESNLTGSASNTVFEKYNNDLAEINKESRFLASNYRKLGNNGKLPREQWSAEDIAKLAELEKQNKEAKVLQNNYLLAAANGDNDLLKLFAIPSLNHWAMEPFNSAELCDAAFDKIAPSLKDSQLRNYYSLEIAEKEKQKRLASEVTVGNRYKDFTQNNKEGKPVTASSIIKKNSYVLIDFWASWCGPCRKENPNLLKAYNAYKDKGFEVLAVSLDKDKAAWLQAVKKDGMPWEQLSDLKAYDGEVVKLYSITGIPSNFLIDNKGVIVATDLREEALHKKLKELLGS